MINKSTRHHFSNENFTSLKNPVKECDMLQMNGQRIEEKNLQLSSHKDKNLRKIVRSKKLF